MSVEEEQKIRSLEKERIIKLIENCSDIPVSVYTGYTANADIARQARELIIRKIRYGY